MLFFGLVALFTVPFVVLGGLTDIQIVPGVPLAGLAVVCPLLAAVICAAREGGRARIRALLARSVDLGRIPRKRWYLPILLLYPAVLVLSYLVLRVRGVDVPPPEIGVGALVLALGLLAGGLCEELGWSGYAADTLLRRHSALGTALLIGAFWTVWHWPALLQVGRSPAWIAWWSLATVAVRVIMVWLFVGTGRSVAAMAVFHAGQNLSWQLFPVHGSHFDQPTVAVLLTAVATGVTIAWGPQTLSGRGAARRVHA